jgi:putative MFS transporter
MFLDAFDIYLAGGVLGAVLKEGWSTLQLNATFVSSTFIGMTLGAWFSGILGDRFGRRFTYQVNLAIFGLASIAAAFAPSMTVLIACRFIIGIGLGAEIVVGYATLTEFVPASSRGRWIGLLAVITNFSLFASPRNFTSISRWSSSFSSICAIFCRGISVNHCSSACQPLRLS